MVQCPFFRLVLQEHYLAGNCTTTDAIPEKETNRQTQVVKEKKIKKEKAEEKTAAEAEAKESDEVVLVGPGEAAEDKDEKKKEKGPR